MNNLVFLHSTEISEEPYTTSDVIANCAEVEHESLARLINDYKKELQEFGEVGFQIGFNPKSSRNFNQYLLNEQQATLIITFLKNTPVVVKFKTDLVREFYRMKSELNTRRIHREIGKLERKSLTDTIREKFPDQKWVYKHYTDLDYKCVLGMTAKQFEAKYNIPDGKLRNYLNAGQLEQIGILEAANKALIDAGYTYEEIKGILSRKFLDHKSA